MDINLVVRVTKLVALLGFLLPWVIVSCSGQEIATATGVQLVTGDISVAQAAPTPGMEQTGAPEEQTQDPDPNPFVIAGLVVVALGLLSGLVLRARIGAAAMLATVLGAAGLFWFSIGDVREKAIDGIVEQQTGATSEEPAPIEAEEPSSESGAPPFPFPMGPDTEPGEQGASSGEETVTQPDFDAMQDQMSQSMDQMVRQSVKVEKGEGFWVTMASLVLAALFALLGVTYRRPEMS